MHKEKNLRMSHKVVFLLGMKKESIFSWMSIFENTSNVNLLNVSYK
jgi:hypothetical protein